MNLALFLLLLLALAVIVAPLAERVRLPVSSTYIVVGFAASEITVLLGWDTGLRWESFHTLIILVLLPALIFEAALHLEFGRLRRDLALVLVLAIPLMLVSTLVSGYLIYLGIGHESGFPLVAALFTGAILSATDPVAVLDLFKKLGAPPRLALLVDGESLFNDATAIVVAGLILSLALEGSTEGGALAGTVEFARVFFGGIAVGLVLGSALGWMYPRLRDWHARALVSLLAAYGSFLCAEELHVSGVMACLAAGLLFGERLRKGERESGARVEGIWEQNAYVANAMVFLLMGVTITIVMFQDRWLAMLVGIAAATVARAVVVYLGVPVVSALLPGEPVSAAYRHVMFWGGVRGAVTLVLALSIPLEVQWWFTAQSVAYGVVLFSLFVQVPTMPLVLRRVPS